jgi:hypothetical protein
MVPDRSDDLVANGVRGWVSRRCRVIVGGRTYRTDRLPGLSIRSRGCNGQ